MIGVGHYLAVGAVLFVLGVFGIFLNRKNVIIIMMSVELILLAVNLNLVGFSAALNDLAGQVMALFVLTVAAAEAAIGARHRRRLLPQPWLDRGRGRELDEGLRAMLYAVAVFAPLLGSLIAGLLGRQIGDRASQAVTITCMCVAAFCGVSSFMPFLQGHAEPGALSLGTWMAVDGFNVEWALRYDTLSAMMVAMVTFIATLIHIYSVGYMSHDATIPRFFSYLSLFTFAMLMLVTADNLVQLFFGWEGVASRAIC